MTEVTTSQPKEDNITTTPVELEKKSDDANNDTKPEVTPTQPEGEASTETKPEEELKPIETGYLHKSSKILMVRHWSKSYFYFGSEAISLPNLRNYYKKNVKKAPVPPVTTKTANAVNATSTSQTAPETTEATGTEPSKVDEPNVATSSKVEETKEPEDKKIETKEPEPEIKEVTEDKGTPAEDKKQTEDKKPETKEEEHEHNASHQIYTNIAHASQTGEGLLFYSKSESDKNLPHGIINLKEVTDVTPINDASARQFSFKIVTSYRTFELFAEKSDERDRWIKTIKEKAAKAQEARETSVETSEGFKDTYDKLVKGTAFTGESKPGELSDDVLSGDDEQQEKPRSADKRKSFLPFVQFGRKTSTAETSHTPTITESTQEDGTKVTTTTESPKVTTTEETEEAKGEEPKSPQKSSKFNFNYFFGSKKPEKEKSKDETHKEGEHSEDKIESTEPSAETAEAATATPEVKSEEKTDAEEKPAEKKEKKEKKKKEGEGATSSDSDSSSDAGDKPETSLVRRVTTKIFGGRRAKSPKADGKHESITRDKLEETEEKKVEENKEGGETSETTPAQTSEQTAEPTVPESSTETTDNKKKEKGGGLFSFTRRKSGSGIKKESSESQEKGESETAAVASASEATDIENTTKVEKETENAGQKSIFPESNKTGNLQKQSFYLRTFESRYFVLTKDNKLLYYKSESDATNHKAIDLSNDCKIKIGEGSKFDIETKTRTYKLMASSPDDRESWINALKESPKVTVVPVHSEKDGKKTEESTKLEVAKDENETNIQESVDNAAKQAADAAEAEVSEAQESTTKSTKVLTTEGAEGTTITTETITVTTTT